MEDLLHFNFRSPSTPERDREQECAQHRQQLQMTSLLCVVKGLQQLLHCINKILFLPLPSHFQHLLLIYLLKMILLHTLKSLLPHMILVQTQVLLLFEK